MIDLIMGTAQLGLPAYGLASSVKDLSPDTARSIIWTAWSSGITKFDTAFAYGASMDRLAECLERNNEFARQAQIICKYQEEKEVFEILRRVRGRQLWALLAHGDSFFDLDFGLFLKRTRVIKYYGLSTYNVSGMRGLLYQCGPSLDILQVPFSLLNQEALQCGLLDLAKRCAVRIFARTVYLQGLLSGILPMFFVHKYLNDGDGIIVGMESQDQVRANTYWHSMCRDESKLSWLKNHDFRRYAIPPGSEKIIDPRTWKEKE